MPIPRLMILVLCATLAACERAQEPLEAGKHAVSVASPEPKTLPPAVPEHFDRVRDEQLEKEEDRLRKRGSAD